MFSVFLNKVDFPLYRLFVIAPIQMSARWKTALLYVHTFSPNPACLNFIYVLLLNQLELWIDVSTLSIFQCHKKGAPKYIFYISHSIFQKLSIYNLMGGGMMGLGVWGLLKEGIFSSFVWDGCRVLFPFHAYFHVAAVYFP